MHRLGLAFVGSTALLGSTALQVAPALAQPTPIPNPQTQGQNPNPQVNPQTMTVQAVLNQPVFRESGREFGRVNRVIRGENGQVMLVVAADNRVVMVPTSQVSLQGTRLIVRATDQQVQGFREYRDGMPDQRSVPVTERLELTAAAGGAASGATAQATPAQGTQVQAAPGHGADASRIVVQQPAPQIQVQQAPPQVAIQQAQPNVTVRQPQPEITVRQPAPTVTIDIPQPEIIVRMPQPEVNVAMAQPQVEVRQPQPQVQVVQPREPQVEVNRAQQQAQVTVQPAQPQITLQRGEAQPQVRYERAEPQVRVNQAQGQPNVRFEQAQPGASQQAAAPATTGSLATAAGAGSAQTFGAEELKDRDIFNLRGEQLGDIDRVLIGPGDRGYVVIGHGGFLGLGQKQILLPLEQIRVQDGRLVMPGLTDEQIRAMPEFSMGGAQGYREADGAFRTQIGFHQ